MFRPMFWSKTFTKYTFLRGRDGDSCHLCKEPINFAAALEGMDGPSIDHLVPKSKGGCNCPSNLKLAHKKCNFFRGNDSLRVLKEVDPVMTRAQFIFGWIT